MKILVISQYYYPEQFRITDLCNDLVSRGHEVKVLTGYPQYPIGEIYEGYGFNIPYENDLNGVRIERLRVRPRGKNALTLLMHCFSFVRKSNRWVRRCKEKFDLVYVYEPSPITVGLPAVKYKNKFNVPFFINILDLWPENVQVVLNVNNKIVIGVLNKIVDKIYGGADRILCSSKSFVRNISDRGVDDKKLVFWPQFGEELNFSDNNTSELLDKDTFNIVFAGNTGNAQGLDLLINAAQLMRDEPVKWYVIGDGRARDELMKQVADKELSDKVVFTGRLSEQECNEYVHNSDCAYLSFKDNALFDMTIPAKLQTYLACSTPVLAAAAGESAEIVNAADCGIVCDRNAEAIAEAVKKIMSFDKDRLSEMSANSFKYYRENYTKKKLVDELEDMMIGMIG